MFLDTSSYQFDYKKTKLFYAIMAMRAIFDLCLNEA